MTNIYELSEELNLSPKQLQKWLRSHGYGSSKTISHRAAREAKAHFAPPTDHPMASALEDRGGLGDIKRHEELIDQGSGIKVEERPKLKWGSVERDSHNVLDMDMNSQKDFFRNLRKQNSSKPKSTTKESPQQSNQASSNQEKTKNSVAKTVEVKPATKANMPKNKPVVSLSEAQTKHSVFGSLSSMTARLDSVTDRPKSRPSLDDAQVMQALGQGVAPLKGKQSKTSKKQSKTNKKQNKKRQPKTNTHVEQITNIPSDSSLVIQGEAQASEPSFQELFERPEVQSLQSKLDALKSELKQVKQDNEALKLTISELEHLQELSRIQETPVAEIKTENKAETESNIVEPSHSNMAAKSEPITETKVEPKLIWEHFESFGLNVTQALLALHELLDHPQRGPELVYSLKHDQIQTLTRGFALVCEEEVCREVADTFARQGLIEFSERHLCSVCQGSDSRAWYKRLLLTASYTQKTKLLIVGGDNHVHQQIKQLSRENPGLEWDFVNGANRTDQGTANAKVAHKAAVVLWSGEHLPHSLSNLFKVAADKSETPISSLVPGQRSVAAVCMSILKSWDVPIACD